MQIIELIFVQFSNLCLNNRKAAVRDKIVISGKLGYILCDISDIPEIIVEVSMKNISVSANDKYLLLLKLVCNCKFVFIKKPKITLIKNAKCILKKLKVLKKVTISAPDAKPAPTNALIITVQKYKDFRIVFLISYFMLYFCK